MSDYRSKRQSCGPSPRPERTPPGGKPTKRASQNDRRESRGTREDDLLQVLTGMTPESQRQCVKELLHHMNMFDLHKQATKDRISKTAKLEKIRDAKRAFVNAKSLLLSPLISAHLESILYYRFTEAGEAFDVEAIGDAYDNAAVDKKIEMVASERIRMIEDLIQELTKLEQQNSTRGETQDEKLSHRGKNASRPDIDHLAAMMLPTIRRNLGHSIGEITLSDSSPYVVIAAKVFEMVDEYDSSMGSIGAVTKRMRKALKKYRELQKGWNPSSQGYRM